MEKNTDLFEDNNKEVKENKLKEVGKNILNGISLAIGYTLAVGAAVGVATLAGLAVTNAVQDKENDKIARRQGFKDHYDKGYIEWAASLTNKDK